MKKYSEECIEKDKKLYELGKKRGKLQRELSDNRKEMKEIFEWFRAEGHGPIQTICSHWYMEWWNKKGRWTWNKKKMRYEKIRK